MVEIEMNSVKPIRSILLLVLFLLWHCVIGMHFHSHHGNESDQSHTVCGCGVSHHGGGGVQGELSDQPEDCALCKLQSTTSVYFSVAVFHYSQYSDIFESDQKVHSDTSFRALWFARGPPA